MKEGGQSDVEDMYEDPPDDATNDEDAKMVDEALSPRRPIEESSQDEVHRALTAFLPPPSPKPAVKPRSRELNTRLKSQI